MFHVKHGKRIVKTWETMFHVKHKIKFMGVNDMKINAVYCDDILNKMGELTFENYSENMKKCFDIYYKTFKKQNPDLFKIKCRVKWGVHRFKNLGDCISELLLSLQFCDGHEYKRYNSDLNKIVKLYNTGKLNENIIVLRG